MNGKREFGDYQTPADFADKVCDYLLTKRKLHPSIVIEPTCGTGSFLKSSLIFDAKQYYGVEINPFYCEECRRSISDDRVTVFNHDFFTFDFGQFCEKRSNILLIGNPPWVTNSALSAFGSGNLPAKTNFKHLRGVEAITGASNFDICEFMILRLIDEFRDTDTTLAMLCKTSVARNVFKELKRSHVNFESCDIMEFDAGRVFGVSAGACVLMVKLSKELSAPDCCNMYSFESQGDFPRTFQYIDGDFFQRPEGQGYSFNGVCCFEWRQGVKHDCAKIMELTRKDGVLLNGKREPVDIEDTVLFPLVKSSMFKKPVINEFSKYVLVTQKKARADTSCLQQTAPKAWRYLSDNIGSFRQRKSVIYRNAPEFSMFGVGDYSYAKYKVGISGFYKKPLFSLLYSPDGKPVMTDDTSYFICFDRYDMAYVAMLLLNSEPVQQFLMDSVFLDAKRPYTKKVLERLSFKKITAVMEYRALKSTEAVLELPPYLSNTMYSDFKRLISSDKPEQLTFAEGF